MLEKFERKRPLPKIRDSSVVPAALAVVGQRSVLGAGLPGNTGLFRTVGLTVIGADSFQLPCEPLRSYFAFVVMRNPKGHRGPVSSKAACPWARASMGGS